MGIRTAVKQILVRQQDKKYEAKLSRLRVTYEQWASEQDREIAESREIAELVEFVIFRQAAGRLADNATEWINAYFAKHPGYLGGQMPTAVLNAWLGGTGLGEAFAEYERGKSRAETRKLQRENQVLRQNAAAAMRAPVRGVGGGGDTKQEPEDPFLMGFNDEKW